MLRLGFDFKVCSILYDKGFVNRYVEKFHLGDIIPRYYMTYRRYFEILTIGVLLGAFFYEFFFVKKMRIRENQKITCDFIQVNKLVYILG